MNQQKNKWSAPFSNKIKSINISQVIYAYKPKQNAYNRPPHYRKQKSISLEGTNSEVY